MESRITPKILLYVSIFSFLYFMFLIYISYFPPLKMDIIRVFGELITLPLLIIVFFSFVYGLVKMLKKVNVNFYVPIFVLNFCTIIFLTIITFIQMDL